MAGRGVPLLKQGDNFVRREVLSAMEVVARRNMGVIKVSEVQEVLKKRDWKISYNALRNIVKEEIKGTGWRLYSEVREKRASNKDPLGRVMAKVREGKKLNKHEREILSAAIDATKKAKSER